MMTINRLFNAVNWLSTVSLLLVGVAAAAGIGLFSLLLPVFEVVLMAAVFIAVISFFGWVWYTTPGQRPHG